ncbi:MurR/RpiR family transcriptional regulator [Saccharopolyspora hattusasensis]|uniref:MurR/RpiR family transcriptional regulator n=1 Tax=Saccharopolyspora hattusasensis TaxID=1128679 RepID=UPI003D970F3F
MFTVHRFPLRGPRKAERVDFLAEELELKVNSKQELGAQRSEERMPRPQDTASTMDPIRQMLTRSRSTYPSLSGAERRVADALEAAPHELLRLPLKAFAERAGVSEATVVRFCQSIGYDGFRGLRIELATRALVTTGDTASPVSPDDDVATITDKVLRSGMAVITDTLATVDTDALAAAVDAIAAASRVECFAVGSSIPVALDLYYRLLRLGVPTSIATDPHMQATSASHLSNTAVAFGISHTGRSFETHAAFRHARAAGAKTILITSYRGTPIGELTDIEIVVASPEPALRPDAGSSRLAHLAVVDAATVALAMRDPDRTDEALLRDDAIISEREVTR